MKQEASLLLKTTADYKQMAAGLEHVSTTVKIRSASAEKIKRRKSLEGERSSKQKPSLLYQFAETFSDITSTYEGRDKLTKLIQFGCKFLGWYLLILDPEQSLRYLSISEKFRDARSVFRLTKFLFEIRRMEIIYENSEDKFSIIINILSRFFYLFHWLFDNMFIIMKLSDSEFPSFTGLTRETIKRLSRKAWLIGISLFLVYCVKILRKTYTDESDLKVAAVNNMTVRGVINNLQIMTKLRRDYQLNFARVFSDLVVCVNENDLPFKVLGKRINHGVEGAFGMLAALIYLYGLFTSKH